MHRIGRIVVAFAVAIATLLSGVTPALAAGAQSDVITHDGPAPITRIKPGQKKIPVSEINQERNLHGVYGLASVTPRHSVRPDDSRLTGWKPLRRILTRLVEPNISPRVKAIPNTGNNQTSLNLTWENSGTSGSCDKQSPLDDAPLVFQARADFTIPGEKDYAPGSVQFTLPLAIFKNYDKNYVGGIHMSIPPDPTPGAVWTYKRLRDNIVVSNAQTVSGGYSGYFEFAYNNIVPHEVPSGTPSDPLTVTLTLQQGSQSSSIKSNTLTAEINTSEKVTSVHKEGEVSSDSPEYTNLDPTIDTSQYWFVNWYMYASVSGNRHFTLAITDKPVNENGTLLNKKDGFIVGTDIPGATVKNGVLTSDNAFTGYVPNGENFYYHVTMAYPRSELPTPLKNQGAQTSQAAATKYNSVMYALTYTPGGTTQSSASDEAVASFNHYSYSPQDIFLIDKNGPANSGSYNLGEDEHGLNELSSGQDFHTSWSIDTTQYNWAETFGGSNLQDPKDYGKKPVTSEIWDDGQWFDSPDDKEAPLTASEGEITSLTFHSPTIYNYKGSEEDGYYYSADTGTITATVEACDGSCGSLQSWHKVATVTSKDDNITIAPETGYSAQDNVLILSKGTTQWRVRYTTYRAALDWMIDEDVTLHPVGRIKTRVADLLKNRQNDSANFDNHVTLYHNPGETIDPNCQNNATAEGCKAVYLGSQDVSFAWQEASMLKRGWQTDDNSKTQSLHLRYELTAKVASNITSQAVLDTLTAKGVLTRDNSGRFYDLLPEGVRPDLSSVTVDGGSVTGTRIVQNWAKTGRQMLVVSVVGEPSTSKDKGGLADYRTLRFNAAYSWMDYLAHKRKVGRNVSAYVSDTPKLGTVKGWQSEPDNPAGGMNNDSQNAVQGYESAMTNLESNPSTSLDKRSVSTLYASAGASVSAVTYAAGGIQKSVSVEGRGDWTGNEPGVNVPEGGTYRYRLAIVRTTGASAMKDIVLADNVEDYTPKGVTTTNWHGQLLSVDTSALVSQGVKPIVYYRSTPFSTGSGINLQDKSWTTSKPATVKAIAIDCSQDTNGKPYTLPSGQGLWAELVMRAPYGKNAASEVNTSTYNGMYLSDTVGGIRHWTPRYYTKATLIPLEVKVVKSWNDEDDRDALRPKNNNNVTVSLTANGTPTGKPTQLDKNWAATFADLPASDDDGNMIVYGATDSVPGYTGTSSVSGPDKNGVITVTLTNTHKPATTSISGTKEWRQGKSAPLNFTLHLFADGKATGKTKTVTPVNGSWDWTWDGIPKNENINGKAVPIRYTVTESAPSGWQPQNGSGKVLPFDHQYASGQRMVNVWHPYGNLAISKSTANTTDKSKDVTFTFTLGLTRSDGSPDPGIYAWTSSDGRTGTISNGKSVTLKAGQTVTVSNIPMGERYAWTETDVKGFHADTVTNSTGVVAANTTTTATVENVYSSEGLGYVEAHKKLTGRPLRAFQFAFTLRKITGSNAGVGGTVDSNVFRQAWNDKDGKVEFSAIPFTRMDDGKDFWYELRETPYTHPGYTSDSTAYRVKLHVADNGDGTESVTPTYYSYDGSKLTSLGNESGDEPTFHNAYKATGKLSIAAQKVFVGGNLAEKSFTFKLMQGTKQVGTATTDASGVAKFHDIVFTQDANNSDAGTKDQGLTHVYTMSEVQNPSDTSVVWDDHTETVSVKVTDNGDGTLSMDETVTTGSGTKKDSTPLVWVNQAGSGSLRITKELASDAQTQAHKKTDFPMRVYLTAPQGGTLPNLLSGVIHSDTTGNTDYTWTVNRNTDNTQGTVDVKVPGDSWIRLDGIPGGTSYQVVEEDDSE